MNSDRPRRILVFRTGQLGDMVAALPAIHALRQYFARDRLVLLCDRQRGKPFVRAEEVFAGAGLFDEVEHLTFDLPPLRRLLQPWRVLRLLIRLRQQRFDAVVYLIQSPAHSGTARRHRLFFRLAGIPRFIGFENLPDFPEKVPGQPLPQIPREGDLLLRRLAAAAIPGPTAGCGRIDLNLGRAEEQEVERWLCRCSPDQGRPWLAVGPGSKMPVKVWPAERYQYVVQRLIERFDVWPVVFGGREDAAVGWALIGAWGRDHLGAGKLSVRAAGAALRRCALYLGNDTGTMHLAAAAGITCVALFSSRDHPGLWFPYGEHHRVFRTAIECEGCMLLDCVKRQKECLLRIEAPAVYAACAEILKSRGPSDERGL